MSTCCCFWLTVSKCGTHFKLCFLIDKCSCKMVNTLLSDMFSSSATSIYDQPKEVCGIFWCFLDNCRIWATCELSIICVCTTMFKVSIPPLMVFLMEQSPNKTYQAIALLEQNFWCFLDNCRIWATCELSIICVCTTMFKVSIPPLMVFLMEQSPNKTYQAIALLEQNFSPSETNIWNLDFFENLQNSFT